MSLVLAAGWTYLRLTAAWRAILIEFPDSDSFLTKAAEPFWTADYFFGSGRFFIVPAFYKAVFALVGPEKAALAIAQALFAVVAWLTFAWTLAARFANAWLGVAAAALALAFGLTSDIIQWDAIVLSESLSTSLFVLLLALWLMLSDRVTAWRVAAVIVCAAAWSMSREANSLLILPLAAAAVAWGWWYWPAGRERRRCAVLAAALVAIFAGTFVISGTGDRWVFPLLNVIGRRVLTTPERTAFYVARGMPVNPRLMAMAGEFGGGQDWAFYDDPELADFRAWLRANGKRAFVEDLAFNPLRTAAEPIGDVQEFVCPDVADYRWHGYRPLYPASVDTAVCRLLVGPFTAGAGFLGIALAAAAWLGRRTLTAVAGFRLLTAAALLAGWLPFTWFTWHVIGDMEIGRHVWSGVLMARTGELLLAVFLLEAVTTPPVRDRAESSWPRDRWRS